MTEFRRPISDETIAYVSERIDKALTPLVPRASDDEILALVRERIAVARETYGDFLGMPDS